MIIAQQVQGSVQGQLTELANLAVFEGLGLTPGTVTRDDDLTEKASPGRQIVTIRKREDIRRSVDIAEPPIQLPYDLVAGENDVDLGISYAQSLETVGNHLSQRSSCGLSRPSIPPDVDPCHLSAASC